MYKPEVNVTDDFVKYVSGISITRNPSNLLLIVKGTSIDLKTAFNSASGRV
jgi:hypothetical protein